MTRRLTKPTSVEEVKNLISMWDNFTIAELAEKLGCTKAHIRYIVRQLRLRGITLPRKSRGDKWSQLIASIRG